jgi:hypothetical protein
MSLLLLLLPRHQPFKGQMMSVLLVKCSESNPVMGATPRGWCPSGVARRSLPPAVNIQ